MSSVNKTVRDGMIMGLIASVAVAVFYAVFDFLAARGVFYTVDLLGKALFQGLRDPSILLLPVQPDTGVILLYSVVHVAIALVIGVIVAALVGHAEVHAEHARWIVAVIVGGFVVTILAVGFMTTSFRELLPWWSIVTANALAVLFAGLYLIRRRRGVFFRLLNPLRAV